MQENSTVLKPGAGAPALNDGQVTEAHGLVVHAPSLPHNFWLDLTIALVVAIAAPFILKKLLETEMVAKMFRPAKLGTAKEVAPASPDEEFDFDT